MFGSKRLQGRAPRYRHVTSAGRIRKKLQPVAVMALDIGEVMPLIRVVEAGIFLLLKNIRDVDVSFRPIENVQQLARPWDMILLVGAGWSDDIRRKQYSVA